MTAYLEIRALRRDYAGAVAVADVDLDVRRGEFLTFLGPSGSGKSTTLYAIAGLDQPSGGDIRLEGRSLLHTPPHLRNIGMVFQRYTLFPHLSVAENVGFPLKVRRRPADEIARRVRRMLELVRLEDFGARKPSELSGGQQQRVAIARALIYEPPLLLMDEPLAALDKRLREDIQLEIRRLHRETGVTILYVTHDQEEALRLSDRIAVFSKGRIEQVGAGAELYGDPATRFVAEFIGDSDFLKCSAVDGDAAFATVRLGEGVVVERVPAHGAVGAAEVDLMLRPERVRLHLSPPAEGVALAATVEDVTFLGAHIQVATKSRCGAALRARLAPGHAALGALAPGAPVWLAFDPDEARVFR